MATNLIKNGNFSQGYGSHKAYKYTVDGEVDELQHVNEIANPKEWETSFVHGLPVPWDEENLVGFVQPEVRLETDVPDPNRIMEGTTHSLHGFGFYKIVDVIHHQVVTGLIPGQSYILSAFAHAWSSNEDEARESEGVGDQAYFGVAGDTSPQIANHTFKLGVNLDGDININNAIWGHGFNIYNKFHALNPIVFTATGTEVAIFIRDTVLWPYRHNDYYWSQISLTEEVEESPGPSEPPETDYEYPVIETGSKLCDHAAGDSGLINAIYDRMQRGAFTPVAKCVADVGPLEAVKLMSPETITIGRFLEGVDDDIDEEGPPLDGNLQETAEKVMNSYMPLWEPHKAYTDYWEVVNEQDPPGTAGHVRLAEFYIYCMDIAEANDYKLAILSYSLGVPEYDEMQALVESGVFARAKAGGHILSLHEYASPTNKWYGQSIPGAEQRNDAGPLCTRYRFLYDLLEAAGQVIPLVITEFNTTEAVKSYTVEEWIANMAWYDERMAEDYYVLGATIFTLATGIWEGFIYIDYIKDLENYMVGVVDRQNALSPTVEPPEPEPEPCPEPRVPYDRVYILIPPDHGFEWVAPLGSLWDAYRFGLGGSADDSGWGPGLLSRTVIALNPTSWPGDLKAFIDEFYEGAALFSITATDPADFERQLRNYYEGVEELRLGYPTTHMPPVITSRFGDIAGRVYPHNGIDLRSSWAVWGDEILCALDGVVIFAGVSAAYGNHVITRSVVNGENIDLRYAHFTYDSAYVREGDIVVKGQSIGKPDNTGISRGDHLHLDMKIGGRQVDPEPYIDWPDEPPLENKYQEMKGVHAAPTLVQKEDTNTLIGDLKFIGMKWFKLLSGGALENISLCSSLVEHGITPIVRLYTHEQFPDTLSDALIQHVSDLINAGVQYFEIGNEPNLPGEWKYPYKERVDFNDSELIQMIATSWIQDARAILALGGKPGIYAMAPTDVNGVNPTYSSVNWLSRIVYAIYNSWGDRDDLRSMISSGKIWLATHSAAFNRPFDFDPFGDVYMDDMCLRGYQICKDIIETTIGVPRVDIINTEGGIFSPEHMDYLEWGHDYDESTWGDRIVEMYKFLGEKGDMLAMCPWTFSDYGVSDTTWHGSGWYRVDNEPRSPIIALLEDVE